MMRVSKIVRVIMDDETVFPFKRLTVEPGKSWRRKVKAFKNAGWIGRLVGASSTVTDMMSRGRLVTNYPHMRGESMGCVCGGR